MFNSDFKANCAAMAVLDSWRAKQLANRGILRFLGRRQWLPFHRRQQLPPCAKGSNRFLRQKGSNCFLLRNEAIDSFCEKKHLLASAEGSKGFLPRKQLLPSAEGSNCFLLRKEAITSFCGRRQLLPSAEETKWTPEPSQNQ